MEAAVPGSNPAVDTFFSTTASATQSLDTGFFPIYLFLCLSISPLQLAKSTQILLFIIISINLFVGCSKLAIGLSLCWSQALLEVLQIQCIETETVACIEAQLINAT